MGLSAFLSGVALLAGAQAATAQGTAHPEAGVLRLANVRIQAASPAQIAEASRTVANPAKAGVRAFKDPDSGELRDQTPEEMMLDGMSQGNAKAATSRGAKALAHPQGGISIPLDESFMANAVVSKDAAGKMHMQCVEGDDAAAAVLERKAGKVHRHDR
jgi:hypothetical protein